MSNPTGYTKDYDYISRYQPFYYYFDNDNNRYYYGLTAYLNNDTSYVLYEVQPGDSYDSIALNHYGCALFWWVITDYNRILDAITPPTPGMQLRLPSLNSIVYSYTSR